MEQVLSIEEKARRYDEAIINGSRLWESGTISRESYEYIFPALKESEDDKIRDEICAYIGAKQDISLDVHNRWLSWLEKQGRQKFKVGDWITDNTSIFQIVRVENEWYYADDGDKICFDVAHQYYHLWTIQEAETGDVLVHNGCTFIFMGIKNGIVQAIDEIMLEPVSFGEPDKDNDYHPATEEQCDQLEKALVDAGYEWDSERKELKKIESKFQVGDWKELKRVVVPIFNIGDTIIKKHNSDINDFGSFVITDITDGKYWYNDRIICDITEQDEWEIPEPVRQNPTWSEEDEEMIDTIIYDLERHGGKDDSCYSAEITWLKSLKDRVQPQSQSKEWSEEDGIWIDRACMLLDELNHLSTLTLAKIPSNVNDIISHLESLKQRIFN